MKKINSAEDYFLVKSQWDNILKQLREIILLTELTETLKWGIPTYTLDGKNVAGLVAFKSFVAIWFFNGVLLKDETYKLINAQAGKTKALRQWRFSSIEEIDSTLIKAYLKEAIKNQQEGKTVKPEKKKPLIIPEMLLSKILQASSFKLSWVVDPFMRRGSVGVAAKSMGRRFIGFETDQDSLLMAMKRIDQS